MSRSDRIAMFPSRANQVLMKGRIISATKGFSLLKRKRDALELRLREITEERNGLLISYEEMFAEALFSIAKANFYNTDLKPAPVIASDRADAYIRLNEVKIIGIMVQQLEPVIKKPESLPLLGLGRGGAQVEIIREKFQELLKVSIILASHNSAIRILGEALRSTNMRMNGLEFVVIPRLTNTAAYIRDELDELEREEFYRLKRSQAKQKALKAKGKKKPEGLYKDAETQTDEMEFPPVVVKVKKQASGVQTIITGHDPSSNEMISPNDSIPSGLFSFSSKEEPMKARKSEKDSSSVESMEEKPNGRFSRLSYVDERDEKLKDGRTGENGEDGRDGRDGRAGEDDEGGKTRDGKDGRALENGRASEVGKAVEDGRAGPSGLMPSSRKSLSGMSSFTAGSVVSTTEMSVQTDITGRYPTRIEMDMPKSKKDSVPKQQGNDNS